MGAPPSPAFSRCHTGCLSRLLLSFCFWWFFWRGAASHVKSTLSALETASVRRNHARTFTAMEYHADHAASGTLLNAPALDPLLLVLQATLSIQMVQNAIFSDPVRQAGRMLQQSAEATAMIGWLS